VTGHVRLDVQGPNGERLDEVAHCQRRHEEIDRSTQRSIAPDGQQYKQVTHDSRQQAHDPDRGTGYAQWVRYRTIPTDADVIDRCVTVDVITR